MPAIVSHGTATNQSVALTGTSSVHRSQIAGPIVFDEEIPVSINGFYGGEFGGTVTAKLQVRVIRSDQTGLLDFYYRAILTSGPISGMQFGVGWLAQPSGTKVTYADYRPDGVGAAAPNKFVFGPNGLDFLFEWPGTLESGTSTNFVFVSTNATEFALKEAYFSTSDEFSTYNLPTPSVI